MTEITVTQVLDKLQASLESRTRERDDEWPGDAQFWADWLRTHAGMVEDASQYKEEKSEHKD